MVSLSVGKSQNYQKLRINYVTATSCVRVKCIYIYKNTIEDVCVSMDDLHEI